MLTVGDEYKIRRTYTQNDIQDYCSLADADPAFVEYVPEPLIGAMYSDMLGTKLPGPGTMYMKQKSQYVGPAPLNLELTATVEVVRIRPENGLVNLRTTCTDEKGTLYCEGEALVLFPPAKIQSA